MDGGAFGFEEELAGAADAEGVIRGLGCAADLDLVLVNYVLEGLGEAQLVVDVAAEGFEEGIDEFDADLSFVVGGAVGVLIVGETVDEVQDLARGGHEATRSQQDGGSW